MNEEKRTKEYLKRLNDMRLSESSRARMRGELSEYADFHAAEGAQEGVRVGEDDRLMGHVPQGTLYQLFGLKLRKTTMHATAAILIAVMIGGGTSFAAENAVPGDVLYPVKVEVNENVKSALAVSNAAEAKLQARLAQERLEEAEQLAAEGRLDAESSAVIRTRLQRHYEAAIERSERAETEANAEVAAEVRATLEGAFRSYADVLSRIDAGGDGSAGADIVSDLNAYADAVADARATATVDANTDVAAAVERAESVVTEVEAALEDARAELSADTYGRINAQFDNAVEAMAEARASLEANARGEAHAAAQRAIRFASEVRSMIKSALRLDVDLELDTGVNIGAGATTQNGADAESETRAGGDSEAESDTETGAEGESDTSADAEAGVEVDLETDTSVDTDSVEAGGSGGGSVETDADLDLY